MKIASYLPKKCFENSAFAALGWSEEKIFAKTGILSRHIASETEFALDLAEKAALNLFENFKIKKEEIDYLLYCTQSPDYLIPTNACILQDRLKLSESIGALDFNLGCSGFVYGLSLAKGLLETGQARSVLLVTAETYSKYIHPEDKSSRVIFGDGAAATLLTQEDARKLGPFVFGTQGAGAKNLCVKTGGLRHPRTALTARSSKNRAGNMRSEDNLYMNGAEIFSFTLSTVPGAVEELLKRSKLSAEEIDHFIFHQANAYMLEALREKMGLPKEKFPIYLEKIGNTVSSTIPILLEHMTATGKFRANQRLVLCAFGVGYSWIATLWNP